MRILIDARFWGLENAGIGRYTMNLVSELAKIDKKNDYLIFLRKKYFYSLDLPSNWTKIKVEIPHYSFAEQLVLPFLIFTHKPDIVHFLHFNVPILFWGRYVVTIHDLLMHKQKGLEATTLAAPIYLIKRFGYRIVFDAAIRNSRKVITPSGAVKNELVKTYGISLSKVYVTYEGIDSKIRESNKSKIEKPYFVYTGNAYPHKNLKRLIKAISILNTNYNQRARLAISSARNIFTQRLRKFIFDLNVQKYVKLLGFTPDDKLCSLYKNSSAFIFPSLSEGFGLPGLEAMSCGTLILASNIPVFREIYEDNVNYFDPLDEYSMAEAMNQVLEMSKNKRKKSILRAQKFVKRYSWAKMAHETLEVYTKSCNSL